MERSKSENYLTHMLKRHEHNDPLLSSSSGSKHSSTSKKESKPKFGSSASHSSKSGAGRGQSLHSKPDKKPFPISSKKVDHKYRPVSKTSNQKHNLNDSFDRKTVKKSDLNTNVASQKHDKQLDNV